MDLFTSGISAGHILTLTVIAVLASNISGRQTDERWLKQPEGRIETIENKLLLLHYRYAVPPGSPSEGKLYFAHHIPETRHENILIEARIDPTTWRISLVYEMFPGKVAVTSSQQDVYIHVTNLTMADSGRYLTDVNFDTDAALHDVVDVVVLARPKFNAKPGGSILAYENDVTSLMWDFQQSNSPNIMNIQMSHRPLKGEWALIVNHARDDDTSLWYLSKDDSDFGRKVAYAPSPMSDKVQVALWNLTEADSGHLKIEVNYENDVIKLEDVDSLTVNKKRKTPVTLTYPIESTTAGNHVISGSDLIDATMSDILFKSSDSRATHQPNGTARTDVISDVINAPIDVAVMSLNYKLNLLIAVMVLILVIIIFAIMMVIVMVCVRSPTLTMKTPSESKSRNPCSSTSRAELFH